MTSNINRILNLKYGFGKINKLLIIFTSVFITTLIISSIIIFDNKPSWINYNNSDNVNNIKLFSYSLVIALIISIFITLFVNYI